KLHASIVVSRSHTFPSSPQPPPKMTRKKKPPPRPKRREITDADGWTHISRSNTHRPTYLSNASSSSQKVFPAEIPSGQTLVDLETSYTHYRQQWLSSSYCQTLLDFFQNNLPASFHSGSQKGTIDRCVVLGLGSLSNGRRSSWWELVFLETVLHFLSTPNAADSKPPGSGFQVYVQDPIFNHMDATFLQSLGYTVLPDPESFDHITSSTFLFAPHLEVEVYVRALDKAKPALCIGTDIGECLDR
ncbi:MAG: hypothetical protein Q9219_006006, partial [cf. Caloplaca sp. 3 TL-2023]